MRSRGRTAVSWLLAAALALPAGGCVERPAPQKIAAGQPFPEARLPELTEGRTVSLAAYRGRPLIVNFWATWCEPCRREMPELDRLSAAARPHGIVVVGVTVDTDLNLAREFVLRHRLRFTNLSDPEMRLARDALGIGAFPETFLVGPEGKIAARFTGARDWTGAAAAGALKSAFGVDISVN